MTAFHPGVCRDFITLCVFSLLVSATCLGAGLPKTEALAELEGPQGRLVTAASAAVLPKNSTFENSAIIGKST